MIISNLLILIGGGLLSGLLAGLGSGGGIILVPLLVALHYTPIQAVATSSLVILISSLSGSFQNWRMGYFDLKRIIQLGIPALITAQIGVYFASRIPPYLLLFLFGIFLLINISLLELKKNLITERVDQVYLFNPILSRLGTGGIAGILLGLFGMGAAIILVPFQMLLLLEPIKVAIQTSLGVIVVTAISACIGHTAEGNILFVEGIILGVGSLLGAQLSTRSLPKLPDAAVSMTFSLFMGTVSIYIFWQSWTLTNAHTFFLLLAITGLTIAALAVSIIFTTLLSKRLYSCLITESFNSPTITISQTTINPKVAKSCSRKVAKSWTTPILLLLLLGQSLDLLWTYRNRAIDCQKLGDIDTPITPLR
jgi:uncharacterized protein